jgi:hypothetical protein
VDFSCYPGGVAEIEINRAPFLTLWASVVGRRLGYAEDEALTLGRAVAGLTAQSKGRRLGVYTPNSAEEREKLLDKREEIGAETVKMMGRTIACVRTAGGLRALNKLSPAEPASVRKYLAARFKDDLLLVESKLVELAATFEPEELDREAMNVYMHLRPNVPKGREGWGKVGLLDTDRIDVLIRRRVG